MLDKLDYFKKYGEGQLRADQAENAAIMELLKEYYRTQGRNVIITPGEKGTLGVTFLCRREEDASGAWFVKSHQPQKTYRDALKREAVLLKAANGDELDVSEISAKPHGGGVQLYVQMRLLDDVKEVTPKTAEELIDLYQERLQGADPGGMYDIKDLLKAACNELEVLSERRFLSQKTCLSAHQQLNWLEMQLPTLERCICHGDFGDRNIMVDQDGKYYVIDWEDAFWGYREYDLIYWLTFFNHRKYYHMESIPGLGKNPELEKATVTLILIIKNAISLYSGSYRKNSLGMEDRLLEMWKIWDVMT